ncbi:MBL fold metallo-hydrolase [Mesorhizobium sp. M7A.F.Ca.CA.001.09.2.1]|nr:MBL fold metallo-hydrolase [Mesorhizobium sp. M7A.F.Ca.CA.001.09.2.1]RUZ00029.1 MBL fold metallo-hydrolase [Mesorhizobium sp. M7A.F.Ca.CA.001.04.2.1]RUZ13854.1 MBL fold metallo-hydrolase [Mesorhizobium sp. M7A.F.Ca.CA.001.09.1.1]RUZ31297.1 MBL fold metallo-hydrolase [Mesorhizobium sp. M7A.F.Ca.CA.001.04.1.1]RUZ43123.1 MBL fold metallo-hydrolase [Mesorhizobium sp. M7A.F.Ca.CA.001.15.1.1]RUZ89081.1 MBL fold metallo-hydrolase [Mesorhizobium sp. M7A.F.Ca.CA.001.14.1.1]RVA67982.1 MBL fold metal
MSTEPMPDRLVLLGSKGGPALRPGGPWPSSSLLQIGGRSIVVDCGLGVTRGLVDAGISLKSLDLIFITHLHSDHVLELGPLIHTAWTAGLATPVGVFGPPGTGHYWRRFCQAMEFDIEIRIVDEGRPDIRDLVSISEFGEGQVVAQGGLTVSALRVEHPPVTDCFALRFEHGAKSVVFSGDTAFYPPLADFARGADILVHEAMLEEGIERLVARTGNGARLREHLLASHSFAEEAGSIASDAGVKRLVLNHLIPADDSLIGEADWTAAVRKTWNGDLTIARDGLVVGLSSAKAAAGEETA